MNTPFSNLSKKVKEIKINGETIYVKPKIRDVELFISLGETDRMSDDDAKKITNIMANMVERAYKIREIETNREDIEDFIAENYATILFEIMEMFGFANKKQIDDLKKNALEKTVNKTQ